MLIASMDAFHSDQKTSYKFGDRSTSDVVVRLRTQEGRDNWIYCHSQILTEKCKYFADRLSEDWPTCQIIDSRSCVEVYCQEFDFDYHVTVLRLFYMDTDGSYDEMWHGVKNALGILQVAFKLGCQKIISACVNYLEAVPWEEAEEEEILKTIPHMGSQVEPIISRLQPVNPAVIRKIFISSIQFATSSPPPSMSDIKSSAQEQLEYMLTEDDDSPLLVADEETRSEVKVCMNRLFSRFNNLVEAILCEPLGSSVEDERMGSLLSLLSDLLWACHILNKLEIMRDFVYNWMDSSDKIVRVVDQEANLTAEIIETRSKVIEVAAKTLEAVGYGTVILPTAKRLQMVKIWLPFVRTSRPLIDSITARNEDKDNNESCETSNHRLDSELWQLLESTFTSIILALPSCEQAEILTDWLGNKQVQYPDLTEAFEVWCYRTKVAKRRLSAPVTVDNEMANAI